MPGNGCRAKDEGARTAAIWSVRRAIGGARQRCGLARRRSWEHWSSVKTTPPVAAGTPSLLGGPQNRAGWSWPPRTAKAARSTRPGLEGFRPRAEGRRLRAKIPHWFRLWRAGAGEGTGCALVENGGLGAVGVVQARRAHSRRGADISLCLAAIASASRSMHPCPFGTLISRLCPDEL